jgi:hypothetical protein
VPDYQIDVGDTHVNLGQLLASRGDRKEGARLVRKGISHYQSALKSNPGNNAYRQRVLVHQRILKAIEGK